MNVYFACSITGGREFESVYRQLVDAMQSDGHEIPTSHLAGPEVMEAEDVVLPHDVYTRDVEWIEKCDALVSEVSVPSHGVGYEIGYALGKGKPVLCLHRRDRKVSKMITGNPHSALRIESYGSVQEAVRLMRSFLDKSS
jgi:nucleoside 2-deoxyribosyltransferase